MLAFDGDRPVGLVHYIFYEHMWRPEGVCYLQDLYVEPLVRGKGVGKILIEAGYAAADAKGAPRVYWLTQEFNATARRLYDRIGKLSPFIKYDRRFSWLLSRKPTPRLSPQMASPPGNRIPK